MLRILRGVWSDTCRGIFGAAGAGPPANLGWGGQPGRHLSCAVQSMCGDGRSHLPPPAYPSPLETYVSQHGIRAGNGGHDHLDPAGCMYYGRVFRALCFCAAILPGCFSIQSVLFEVAMTPRYTSNAAQRRADWITEAYLSLRYSTVRSRRAFPLRLRSPCAFHASLPNKRLPTYLISLT